MSQLVPLREKPAANNYKKGDHLVLFGELFQRGYANGLVEEAERQGLSILRSTVGRREKDGSLRPLTSEELALQPGPVINVPLEAGFDMQADSHGRTPLDALKDVKLTEWKEAKIDFTSVQESLEKGRKDFRERVQSYLKELEPQLQPGRNVLMAHLMAGGVPRAKIVMPLMNRAFKGKGERYLSSKEFWESPIGRLCEMSFYEVTAETFKILVEETQALRKKVESGGGQVSYVAYGYHGTEVMMRDRYRWTTYSPYLQGWAKLRLEEYSIQFHRQGVKTCVYNCPEILTNSSSIFQGVEVFLYMLIEALKHEAPGNPKTQKVIDQCQSLLKDEVPLSHLIEDLWQYFDDPVIVANSIFEKWPQHSAQAQLERMLNQSDKMLSWHKNEKDLMTTLLSEVVFEGCGYAMLHDSWNPKAPVRWLGHDLVARCMQSS